MQTANTQHSGDVHPHVHEIHINKKLYKVTEPSLTGAQLKALGGIPAENQLFLEQHGGKDMPIGDPQAVEMNDGLHFYDVAPGTFGHGA
jgi:Multiubiquitin